MNYDWDNINALAEIRNIRRSLSNSDGESSNIEFKGCSDRFTKADKTKAAKEICAMANTYGGLLCLHAAGDEEINPFDGAKIDSIEVSTESWLPDSMEPPIRGLRIKQVEGVLLIDVPESNTKPHRSKPDQKYYYRSNSLSVPMPEIMVSALYRQTAALDIEPSASMSIHGNGRQLSIDVTAKNNSRVLGTLPMFFVELSGDCKEDGIFSEKGKVLEVGGFFTQWRSPKIYSLGHFSTNKEFRRELLYPEHILHMHDTFPVLKNPPNLREKPFKSKYYLLQVRLHFAEVAPVDRCFVFERQKTSELKKVAEGERQQMISAFLARV